MAKSDDEIIRDVKRLINRHEKIVKAGFLEAVEKSRDSVNMSELSQAILIGDEFIAYQATNVDNFENELLDTLTIEVQNAFKAGVDSALKELPESKKTMVSIVLAKQELSFTNTAAQEYFDAVGAALITNISEQTRIAIRQIIRDAIANNLPVSTVAKTIREIVGLNSIQERAIARQRQALTEKGVKQSVIEATIARRIKKMIKTRAETIARTETGRAVGAGRQQMWDEMVSEGVAEPDTLKKWNTSRDERVGEDHGPMHNITTLINEPFYIGVTGQSVQQPRESRPNCRCVATLIFRD